MIWSSRCSPAPCASVLGARSLGLLPAESDGGYRCHSIPPATAARAYTLALFQVLRTSTRKANCGFWAGIVVGPAEPLTDGRPAALINAGRAAAQPAKN